jgi:hypothetical protein
MENHPEYFLVPAAQVKGAAEGDPEPFGGESNRRQHPPKEWLLRTEADSPEEVQHVGPFGGPASAQAIRVEVFLPSPRERYR